MSQSVPQEFLDELYAIPGNRVSLRYLIEQLNRSGVTVVAGSGISVKVGYPRWSKLRRKLGQMVGITVDDPSPDQIIAAAGELFLYDALEENFAYPKSDPLTWQGPIVILPYLTSRIITTNWDNAIEECYQRANFHFARKAVGKIDSPLTRPWIWKMCGTIEDRQSLEIRQTEFDGLYGDPRAPVIVPGVEDSALLFLGQPYHALIDVAYRMKTVTDSQATAYAVISAHDEIDVGRLSKMSIRAVRCPEFDGQGEELLLRLLADEPSNDIRAGTTFLPPFVSQKPPVPEVESRADDSAEAPASSAPEVPADLIQSCLNGECVLFAGAGLSARAGVVTWYRFLQNLLAFAQSHRVLDTSYASSMGAALQEGERDAIADGLAQAFGDRRNLLHDFLRESFPAGTALAPAGMGWCSLPAAERDSPDDNG